LLGWQEAETMQRVPKFVVQRLEEIETSDPHPAAELLAAFAEQLLPQAERELVLHHLADCADCRQVVTLALPAHPEVGVAANDAPLRKTWLRLPVLRWGFAAAGILALTLGAVFEYRQHQKKDETLLPPASQNEDVSQTKTPTNPLGFQPRDTAENGGRTPESATKSSRPFGMKKSPAKSAILAGSSQLSPRRKNNAAVPSSESQPADSSLQTARSQVSDQLVQKQAQSKDVVKAKAAVPAETQASNSQAPAQEDIPLHTSLMLGPSPRWAVSSTGGLQKSFDAGRTWETVNIATDSAPSQPKFVYRAVTAIGPEVWAGGTGPTLYHSVDSGAHWQTVVPSAMNVYATGDIASVEFSDQKNGSVTLSSGEIWVTSDSGQSWQRRQ
jgi:hypothetical protein